MLRVENAASLELYLRENRSQRLFPPQNYAANIARDWHYGSRKKEHEEVVESKHTPISVSDFEFIDQIIHGEFSEFTVSAALGSIKGKAGHEITDLVTEMVRDFKSHDTQRVTKKINSITSTRESLKPHEKAIMDGCLEETLGTKEIAFRDIPEAAYDVWKRLRQEFFFYKKPTNSKHMPVYGGEKFTPEWAAMIWNFDFEQHAFEESIFGIHSLKIKRYLEQDLFGPQKVFLPLEFDVGHDLKTEEAAYFQIDHGPFKTQYKGQKDWLIDGNVIIDQKYTLPVGFDSLPNRLQVLAYCLGAKGLGKSWYLEQIDPSGIVFLYEVYDHSSADSYYIDASIEPHELSGLAEKLFLYSAHWHSYMKDERYSDVQMLYESQKNAIVLPHLPYPDEVEKYEAGFIAKR